MKCTYFHKTKAMMTATPRAPNKLPKMIPIFDWFPFLSDSSQIVSSISKSSSSKSSSKFSLASCRDSLLSLNSVGLSAGFSVETGPSMEA